MSARMDPRAIAVLRYTPEQRSALIGEAQAERSEATRRLVLVWFRNRLAALVVVALALALMSGAAMAGGSIGARGSTRSFLGATLLGITQVWLIVSSTRLAALTERWMGEERTARSDRATAARVIAAARRADAGRASPDLTAKL